MDSKGVLLAGAVILLGATAGISTLSGEGWILPMSVLLGVIFAILLFALMLKSGEQQSGSTPTSTSRNNSIQSENSAGENLPDPSDAGFDIPIL